MNLPEGVSYLANRKLLCGRDGRYLVQVPGSYQVTDVELEAGLIPYLRGDWYDWAAVHSAVLASSAGGQQPVLAYATARDCKFRINVVPEVCHSAPDGGKGHPVLLGALVDCFPAKSPVSPVERIYEFQTFGMAVIDSGQGHLDLWPVKPGDKVSVPARAYCALYGLGETLITLELECGCADHKTDDAWEACLKEAGPPLLGYYNRQEVVFVLNRLHVNSPSHRFGVRLGAKPDPEARSVRVSRVSRNSLAAFLYQELTTNLALVAQLRSLGMRINRASPEVILPEDPLRQTTFATPIYFSGRLKDESARDCAVRRYLCGQTAFAKVEASSWQELFTTRFTERIKAARRLVDFDPEGTQAFNIVIEGTGEWTEKRYRPAVLALSKTARRPINVYYANDESWKPAPAWRGTLRKRGKLGCLSEIYLNKDRTNPQRAQYDRLAHIDAVFVVTPDVTHVETAEKWLGRTPVIFIEKPMDTDAERFRGLLYSMARSQVEGHYKTAVVGIDHYLMRLSPLLRYIGHIAASLGGLAGVSFEMTEKDPIEPGRERTLSLGLGMDMLPHFAAVLLLLGPLKSIDLVRVLRAVQYTQPSGLEFDNETGLRGACHAVDYAAAPIEATFCAGKAIQPACKQFRVKGVNGQDLVIDFDRNMVASSVPMIDPILGSAECYEALIKDVYKRRDTILSACLTVSDGEQVVRFVDTMWRAVQWIKQSRGLEQVARGTEI